MKNKLNNTPAFVGLVFMAIGLIFLIVGIIIGAVGSNFAENADEVMALITEIDVEWDADGDIHHKVFVDYSYNGQDYQYVHLDYYSSSMFEGDEIEILVSRENPRKISSAKGTMVMVIIFASLGLAFTIGAMIPFILMIRNKAKRTELMKNGRPIYATVEKIGQNNHIEVNGKNPHIVYCVYEDIYSGVVYRFKSKNIWTDPNPVIQPGSTVTVYVGGPNPEDYSKYYVDVESVLNNSIVDYT